MNMKRFITAAVTTSALMVPASAAAKTVHLPWRACQQAHQDCSLRAPFSETIFSSTSGRMMFPEQSWRFRVRKGMSYAFRIAFAPDEYKDEALSVVLSSPGLTPRLGISAGLCSATSSALSVMQAQCIGTNRIGDTNNPAFTVAGNLALNVDLEQRINSYSIGSTILVPVGSFIRGHFPIGGLYTVYVGDETTNNAMPYRLDIRIG
jgi:hypothetical protein